MNVCDGYRYVQGRSWRCTRAATEFIDGQHLCKAHASGLRRRQANQEKRDQNREKDLSVQVQTADRAAEINAALGITTVRPLFSWLTGNAVLQRGSMVISQSDLEFLVEKMRGVDR